MPYTPLYITCIKPSIGLFNHFKGTCNEPASIMCQSIITLLYEICFKRCTMFQMAVKSFTYHRAEMVTGCLYVCLFKNIYWAIEYSINTFMLTWLRRNYINHFKQRIGASWPFVFKIRDDKIQQVCLVFIVIQSGERITAQMHMLLEKSLSNNFCYGYFIDFSNNKVQMIVLQTEYKDIWFDHQDDGWSSSIHNNIYTYRFSIVHLQI